VKSCERWSIYFSDHAELELSMLSVVSEAASEGMRFFTICAPSRFHTAKTQSGHRAHSMEVRSKTVSYHYPSLYDVLSLAKAQTDPALLKLRLLKEHGHGQHEGTNPQE
jgi:hypothetical protein